MKKILFIGMIILITASNLNAKPSELTSYLMKTPVNLFDLVMWKIELKLKMMDVSYIDPITKVKKTAYVLTKKVVYDWDKNSIDIHVLMAK